MDIKRAYNVNVTGAVTKQALLTPGTTVLSGGTNKLPLHSKIIVREVDLILDGAGVVELFVGDISVFRRELSAAGEIHALDRELNAEFHRAYQKPLSISVSTAITVAGVIWWSFDWAGGRVVKSSRDSLQ